MMSRLYYLRRSCTVNHSVLCSPSTRSSLWGEQQRGDVELQGGEVMYKHKIRRADWDAHAIDFLDKYLNDGWVLLSHIVYPSERDKFYTRSSSGFQHVLVFQKFIPEKNDTVSEEEAFIKAKLDEFAFADMFGSE